MYLNAIFRVVQTLRKLPLIIIIWSIFAVESQAVLLPNTLHFIWIGPKIKTEYLTNIATIAEVNPEYLVKVWTDQPDSFSGLSASIKIESVERLIAAMPEKLREYFYHEIQAQGYADPEKQLAPNYAAASDLLRIQALKLDGGIYLDTDISVKKGTAKSGKFGSIEAPLGFLLSLEFSTVYFQDGRSGKKCNFNNHMEAAVADHPILHYMEKIIMENYALFLVDAELAKEHNIESAEYGFASIASFKCEIHANNFWHLKLGYATNCRYFLVHETTGLKIIRNIIDYCPNFKEYYKTFSTQCSDEEIKTLSQEILLELIRFPAIHDLHHDNKVLWLNPLS